MSPAAFCSHFAFTVAEKGVEITNKRAIGIEKYGVDPHAPKPLAKLIVLP
jgi:hypothetical protein